MNDTTQTPAADTARGERVRLLIDQDMADTVARLNNLNQLLGMVKGSLKIELGLPDRIEDEKGE